MGNEGKEQSLYKSKSLSLMNKQRIIMKGRKKLEKWIEKTDRIVWVDRYNSKQIDATLFQILTPGGREKER